MPCMSQFQWVGNFTRANQRKFAFARKELASENLGNSKEIFRVLSKELHRNLN